MQTEADWASLPPELLALVCRALLADLHAHGPCTLRDASRAMAALSPCAAWRRVALEEVRSIAHYTVPVCSRASVQLWFELS